MMELSLGFGVCFADYRLALLGGDDGTLTSRGSLGHEADARNLDLWWCLGFRVWGLGTSRGGLRHEADAGNLDLVWGSVLSV
jgi:hypothetical protein